MKASDNYADTDWMCESLGITRTWLSQLANQGVVKRVGHGRYLLKESVRGYCEWMAERVERNKDAKKRIAELQAEKLQIEVNRMKNLTFNRDEVLDTFAAVLTDIAAIMRNKFEHELPPLYNGLTTGERAALNAEAWAEAAAKASGQVVEFVGEPVAAVVQPIPDK